MAASLEDQVEKLPECLPEGTDEHNEENGVDDPVGLFQKQR